MSAATRTTTTAAITEVLSGYLSNMRRRAGAGLLTFILNLSPVPASRPRVGRFGTYYPKTYEKWRAEAEKQAAAFEIPETLTGPLHVLIENVVAVPKTSKLDYPRGDVDNYAKGPLDALQKATDLFADDNQVVLLTVAKRFAEPGEEPSTTLHVYELEV
jgi:Holliday junction resolvase RusA-like endonuclease